MTYRTLRQRFFLSAGSTMIIGLLVAATEQQASAMPGPAMPDAWNNTAHSEHADSTPHAASTSAPALFWDAVDARPKTAWSRLRESFAWDIDELSPAARARVDKWINRYRKRPENIVGITQQARPWLAWITQQVEERGLPGEIALLPFIESSFDPTARNYSGAAGMWQFMPRTGDALGLVRNGRYDGRLDVTASTQAALDYIEMQADQWYEGDVTLSLAAYNAGAGTVNSARRRAQRQGTTGDYWTLDTLPGETLQYLPKLYAIAQIVRDPERYNVTLPEIDATPAFTAVELDQPVTLKKASRMLGVSHATLARLNPGALRGALAPNEASSLLVPQDADPSAMAVLAGDPPPRLASTPAAAATHRVEPGDNLSTIATRYNVSQQDLLRLNALKQPSKLRPGQLLTLSDG